MDIVTNELKRTGMENYMTKSEDNSRAANGSAKTSKKNSDKEKRATLKASVLDEIGFGYLDISDRSWGSLG